MVLAVRVALAVSLAGTFPAFIPHLSLPSAAWSSGRPAECTEPAGRAANVWERAKSPDLRRYCDLIASASSKLAGISAMAQGAFDAAKEADRVLPGRAAPLALEGRALVSLGDLRGALAALSEAKSRDRAVLDDPAVLLAWARALARTGKGDEAADAYRSLLPRAGALPGPERASAEVEAGLVAMARGAAGLDEATAAFRQALRDGQNEAHLVAVLGLALALDRRGEAQQGRALLGERARGDPREPLASSRTKEILAVSPDETHALAALALEAIDPAQAREEWQKAIAGAPEGRWSAHARSHLAALAGGRADAPRAAPAPRSPPGTQENATP